MCGEVECVATTVCVLGRCGGVYLPKCSAGHRAMEDLKETLAREGYLVIQVRVGG